MQCRFVRSLPTSFASSTAFISHIYNIFIAPSPPICILLFFFFLFLHTRVHEHIQTARETQSSHGKHLPEAIAIFAMAAPTKTLAFFGATGGCAGFTLANALKAGYTCTALARSAEKLTASLAAKKVPADTIAKHLTIVQGNAHEPADVRSAIAPNDTPVDIIISGIGGAPVMQRSIRKPIILDQPTICQDVGAVILKVARELAGEKKPLFVNFSTTGIPAAGKPWDVPMLLTWIYRYTLVDPHEDKARLQEAIAADIKTPGTGIAAYINVKCSLLLDGEGKGLEKVRVGVEDKPAVGYSIQRADVGKFTFERIVAAAEIEPEWLNNSITITY